MSNISIKPFSKEDKISLFILIITAGFFVAVVFHYVMGVYLGKPWPANTFLHIPNAHFWDFILVVRQSRSLDPFTNDIGGFAGAPFAQFVGYMFSLVSRQWIQLCIFFGTFFIVFVIMAKHFLYGLKSKITSFQALAIFLIVFVTYPVLFAVDRANFDLLTCGCLFLFAFTYERQQYKTSAIFLAVAIAIKIYPAVFILVYIFDKKNREALLVIFGAILLTSLSLFLFKDGLVTEAQKYINAFFNATSYLSSGNQQAFNSDLYGLLTVTTQFIGHLIGRDIYLPVYPEAKIIYAILVVFIFMYFMVYLWYARLHLWRILSVLTILLILDLGQGRKAAR